MTTYTVASDGTITPTNPAFPQSVIDDILLPDGTYDETTTTATVVADGNALTLRSLFIGSAIEIDLGIFTSPTLTGTGSITGATDTTKILPAFVSSGGTVVDINGTIAVNFVSNGQLTVSAGERLMLEGEFSGMSASAVTVATGGELDINSVTTASVSALTSAGTVKVTAPTTRFIGATTLGGTVLVQGDAQNGFGTGTLAARTTAAANGQYVAALDLRNATFTAPINSLTLAQDASVAFGAGNTTVARFAVAPAQITITPHDLIKVDGTLTVTGDGSGASKQVGFSNTEFAGTSAAVGTGLNTIVLKVAASDGGARLLSQNIIDANTTLRNDGTMQIGGDANNMITTFIGAKDAAAGSVFINNVGAQLTITAGGFLVRNAYDPILYNVGPNSLSVAAIQNAGVITVAGNTYFEQSFTNTGTVDVTFGTLALEAAVQGTGGTFAVENGATLSLDAAFSQAVAIRNGGTLRLSQPTSFTGTLEMPATDASIDLAGITATAATVSNNTITVTTSTGTLNFAASGIANGTSFGLGSDGAGGSLLTVTAGSVVTNPPTTATNPVAYRFFDSVHGTQFLTTSDNERQTIQNTRPDLVYEGAGLTAVDPATDANAAPVYRFFDNKFGTHFYTSSSTERDAVAATRPDLVSEGIGFYEHNAAQPGDVPVYRFFDSNFGTHFYTASATERATVVATRPDLIAEGISFYAPNTNA